MPTNDEMGNIVGVFNLNEIVRGFFQSAYLGYYGIAGHEGKGNMSEAQRTHYCSI